MIPRFLNDIETQIPSFLEIHTQIIQQKKAMYKESIYI